MWSGDRQPCHRRPVRFVTTRGVYGVRVSEVEVGLTGGGSSREIRRLDPEPRVVVVTAYSDSKLMSEASLTQRKPRFPVELSGVFELRDAAR